MERQASFTFSVLPCPDVEAKAANGAARLGLLGGIFEDGSFSVYSIPDPDVLFKEDSDSPTFSMLSHLCVHRISADVLPVHLPSPILRIELDESPCFTFDWANSELVVIGTTTGQFRGFPNI